MKNKLICKILIIIMLVLFTISTLNTNVYAAAMQQAAEGGGGSSGSSSSGGSGSSNFDIDVYDNGTADESIKGPVNTIAGAIISVMRIICVGVALIMLMVLAIKYMASAPGERAEIKKSAVQYVIGAVVFMGAGGILTLINTFMTGVLQ